MGYSFLVLCSPSSTTTVPKGHAKSWEIGEDTFANRSSLCKLVNGNGILPEANLKEDGVNWSKVSI